MHVNNDSLYVIKHRLENSTSMKNYITVLSANLKNDTSSAQHTKKHIKKLRSHMHTQNHN